MRWTDIKPDNIYFTPSTTANGGADARLGDFGCAMTKEWLRANLAEPND